MKFKILAMLLGMSLFAFSAYATTYTINDNWNDWYGYTSWHSSEDTINDPQVEKLVVTTDDLGILEYIDVFVQNRITSDALFINSNNIDTGSSWDSWDYLVLDGSTNYQRTQLGVEDDGFYSVSEGYNYTLATTGRIGNPNGIETQYLNELTSAPTIGYDGDILRYDFSLFTIDVTDGFFLAYAPYCANDVIGSPVPEPATMVLLGMGLVGLAFVRRKN